MGQEGGGGHVGEGRAGGKQGWVRGEEGSQLDVGDVRVERHCSTCLSSALHLPAQRYPSVSTSSMAPPISTL